MKKNRGWFLVVLVCAWALMGGSCKNIACGVSDALPFCDQTLKNADKQMAAGNCAGAIPLYQQYLGGQPKADKVPLVKGKISDCYFNLGEAAFSAGNFEEAINNYSQSDKAEAKAGIDNSNLALGDAALAAGNYEGAIEAYGKVQTPAGQAKLSEVAYAQGEAAFQESRWQDAANFYAKSQNPDAAAKMSKCYLNLGNEAFDKKDYQAALDSYKKSNEPETPDKIKAAEDALKAPAKPVEAWAILARSVGDEATAREAVARFKGMGFPAYSVGNPSKGWKVYIGNYGSKAAANSALAKLQGQDKKSRGAIVLKVK